MASDVLKDLISALCSLNVVLPVEGAAADGAVARGTSPISERRDRSSREAA
jgi:hypothetical protein